jgi:hypothetical protein
MGFEEQFSRLFDRKSQQAAQGVAAAKGQAMPPAGGNRLTNFLPFPPGTDPSLGQTSMIQRGLYRIPQTITSVVNNNSPLPVSAKPSGGNVGVRVSQANDPTRPVARGATSATWQDRLRSRAVAAQTRIRGALGG